MKPQENSPPVSKTLKNTRKITDKTMTVAPCEIEFQVKHYRINLAALGNVATSTNSENYVMDFIYKFSALKPASGFVA